MFHANHRVTATNTHLEKLLSSFQLPALQQGRCSGEGQLRSQHGASVLGSLCRAPRDDRGGVIGTQGLSEYSSPRQDEPAQPMQVSVQCSSCMPSTQKSSTANQRFNMSSFNLGTFYHCAYGDTVCCS